MKIKVGYIGTGAMGLSHIKIIEDRCNDLFDSVAICDTDKASLSKAKEALPDAKAFGSGEELLGSDVDAVIISTPNDTHKQFTIRALEAKKHVFVEKPVAITKSDCIQMVKISNRSDCVVMIGHELRYSPLFEKAKALIDSGEIGQPLLTWCREFRKPFLKKVDDWIQDSRRSGGSLVEKNCHHFDIMNWWVGSHPKSVSGFGGNEIVKVIGNEHEVLDHASIAFQYENGVCGNLMLCLCAPELQGEHLKMGFIGDEGMIETRLSDDSLVLWKRGLKDTPETITVNEEKIGHGNHHGFLEEHTAFYNAITNGDRPLTDIHSCVAGTLLAIAAEEAIKRQAVVNIFSPEITKLSKR